MHAVRVYNRTPMQRLKWRTPYEILEKKKPDLQFFKVFGCTTYVFLPQDKRANKHSPKSEQMIYLGIKDSIKGYLFMRMPNNILFIGTTAIFIKDQFPRCPLNKIHGQQPCDDTEHHENRSIPDEDDDEDEPFPRHPPSSTQRDPPPNDDDHGDDPAEPAEDPMDPPLPPSGNQPPADEPQLRHSGRHRTTTKCPGNVYVEQAPPSKTLADIEKMSDWKKLIGKLLVPDPTLPQSNRRDTIHCPRQPVDTTHVAKLAQEGGVGLINYLLNQAIPPNESLPDPDNVRNWTYKDILRMPKAQQELWKQACREELEALRRRNVFEVVSLPQERKAIKSRWTFNIKTDG